MDMDTCVYEITGRVVLADPLALSGTRAQRLCPVAVAQTDLHIERQRVAGPGKVRHHHQHGKDVMDPERDRGRQHRHPKQRNYHDTAQHPVQPKKDRRPKCVDRDLQGPQGKRQIVVGMARYPCRCKRHQRVKHRPDDRKQPVRRGPVRLVQATIPGPQFEQDAGRCRDGTSCKDKREQDHGRANWFFDAVSGEGGRRAVQWLSEQNLGSFAAAGYEYNR